MQRAPLLAAVGLLSPLAAGQTFTTVAPGDSAIDMSSDGNLILVAGFSDWAVVDVAAGTRTPIAAGGDFPVAISDNGLVLGDMDHPTLGDNTSGILTGGTWVSLGTMGGATSGCPDLSNPYDLSDDGQVAVGLGWDGCTARAYKWTGATGMVQLPQIGPNATRANVVSADGSTIGGWDEDTTGPRRATVWFADGTQELVNVTPSNPTGIGEVFGLSDDGNWACGSGLNGVGPFLYSKATGTIELGVPPGGATSGTFAYDVSNDGKVVIGVEGNFLGSRAWIWTCSTGSLWMDDYFAAVGITLPPDGIKSAFEISADGTRILGTWGTGCCPITDNAFLATIPAQPTWSQYGIGASPVNYLDLDGGGSTGLGQVFEPVVSNIPAASLIAATGISPATANLSALGGILLIDPTFVTAVVDAHTGSGTVTHSIPIPGDPTFWGTDVYMQSLCDDFTQPAGWGLSNGLTVSL